MKWLIKGAMPILDIALLPVVLVAAVVMKFVRRSGVWRMPFCKKILMGVGVFPINNHYYEPLFDERLLRQPLNAQRTLPGIDWNEAGQLEVLKRCRFGEELKGTPRKKRDDLSFYLENSSFGSGDAEFLYNIIRLKKPSNFIEIGSGNSTLMAKQAIAKNSQEGHPCNHVCIEPFEMPWLEKTGVTVVRKKVEEMGLDTFSVLGENDILFIDSSHIIRPQGDVLFEYLELLPSLRDGVIVHVHDIFSPRDYLKRWVVDEVRFWNEQYLLEALLSYSREWKIIGAINYLRHNHYTALCEACPFLTEDREPGSFYMQKNCKPH